MRVDNGTGKGTYGMDKFSSEVHRVHIELGGKLLNSLRIETQSFERLQSVGVADGADHTQKDDAESKGGSSENVAEIFVLFLCGFLSSNQSENRFGAFLNDRHDQLVARTRLKYSTVQEQQLFIHTSQWCPFKTAFFV
jgi:hypothetical protein